MRLLLDTNRYSDPFRERQETVNLVEEAEVVCLPQSSLALHLRDAHFDHLPQIVRV